MEFLTPRFTIHIFFCKHTESSIFIIACVPVWYRVLTMYHFVSTIRVTIKTIHIFYLINSISVCPCITVQNRNLPNHKFRQKRIPQSSKPLVFYCIGQQSFKNRLYRRQKRLSLAI